jgi:hypothetical protein
VQNRSHIFVQLNLNYRKFYKQQMDTVYLRRHDFKTSVLSLHEIQKQQLRQKITTDTLHFARAASLLKLSQVEEILIHLLLLYG